MNKMVILIVRYSLKKAVKFFQCILNVNELC